ncbi:uncharacterized protein LAESUDRAFT_457405 [Laetiporus sulphureus 93-53]|uniref:Uncharacterized protein n=1 Tax=Laetiporus sulphureus 93-53 TaxID=1314785 RepID=A0A165BR78_9APHY|nr:uncharacterized protein LAESUDRAFT_457405 [Laetiporus sulphureus 93-53]KZT01505.1 hypothetical protein LAESUDRAFT_457405 [Laetiporus sulphureus 93-53]
MLYTFSPRSIGCISHMLKFPKVVLVSVVVHVAHAMDLSYRVRTMRHGRAGFSQPVGRATCKVDGSRNHRYDGRRIAHSSLVERGRVHKAANTPSYFAEPSRLCGTT